MQLKPGVKVAGARPELVIAMVIADGVFYDDGYPMTITSVTDGQHSDKSLHYAGAAFDLRTRHLDWAEIQPIVDTLRHRLGLDYDVVAEADHIHVEYQPRRSLK